MSKPKTTVWLVGTDDGWSGIYIDGKSVHQNHGINIGTFMEYLQEAGLAKDVDFRSGYVDGEEANRAIEDRGCFPDDFCDIEMDIS